MLSTIHHLRASACLLQAVAAAVPVEVDESYREKLPHIPLDFDDAEEAFKSKSNLDIIRTWAVLSSCQIQPLVKNADSLLAWSQKAFGSTLVNFAIRHTFFGHFCAGDCSCLSTCAGVACFQRCQKLIEAKHWFSMRIPHECAVSYCLVSAVYVQVDDLLVEVISLQGFVARV